MTSEEVKKLTAEEIGLELKRLRDRIYALRTQTVTEKLEDHTQFIKVRRDVARLLTERNARRIASMPPAKVKALDPESKAGKTEAKAQRRAAASAQAGKHRKGTDKRSAKAAGVVKPARPAKSTAGAKGVKTATKGDGAKKAK